MQSRWACGELRVVESRWPGGDVISDVTCRLRVGESRWPPPSSPPQVFLPPPPLSESAELLITRER